MAVETDIFQAAGSGDAKAVKSLLKADPGLALVKDERGNTALHYAAIGGHSPTPGHLECARRLIRCGADVKAPGHEDNIGMAPPIVLAAFASRYNVDMVRLLLKRRANPNAKSSLGVSALGTAAEHGADEICTALLEGGAEMDIHSAASLGKLRVVQDMIWGEPQLVNAKDEYRKATPLYYAAQQDHKDVLLLLMDFGADISATTRIGNTALHVAAAAGAARTLEALIDLGADVNARNHTLQTPLHWAVEEWWAEGTAVVKMLLERGADPRIRDDQKVTPLLKAQQRNKTHLVELLRKHGARE